MEPLRHLGILRKPLRKWSKGNGLNSQFGKKEIVKRQLGLKNFLNRYDKKMEPLRHLENLRKPLRK